MAKKLKRMKLFMLGICVAAVIVNVGCGAEAQAASYGVLIQRMLPPADIIELASATIEVDEELEVVEKTPKQGRLTLIELVRVEDFLTTDVAEVSAVDEDEQGLETVQDEAVEVAYIPAVVETTPQTEPAPPAVLTLETLGTLTDEVANQIRHEFLVLLNAERVRNGRSTLVYNPLATHMAQLQSDFIAFENGGVLTHHKTQNWHDWQSHYREEYGVLISGGNALYQWGSAVEINDLSRIFYDGWYNSFGHRVFMLSTGNGWELNDWPEANYAGLGITFCSRTGTIFAYLLKGRYVE